MLFHWIRNKMSPVLSDRTILNYNRKGQLIETPLSLSQVQPNSIDLTLANGWKRIKAEYGQVLDPAKPIEYESGTFGRIFEETESDRPIYHIVHPKEFVLMASNEVLNIPNGIIAFVQGRSSIARLAIQTEQAGLIDAGFRGTITFEVFNQSEYPIKLYENMRIAQVYFFKAEYADRIYGKDHGSKYNGQIDPTESRLYQDFK